MNFYDIKKRIILFFLILIGVVISSFILVQILSTDRSFIAELMTYLGFAFVFSSILWPRAGLVVMLFLCGYLDFIKRLIVLTQGYQFMDVIDILKVAPYTFVGVIVGLILERVLTGKNFSFREIILFLLVTLVLGGLVIKEYMYSKDLFGTIATMANNYMYVLLVFVAPLAFRTIDELIKYSKLALWIFLPVALYGIWQSNFGLANFEHDYLLTGYTITLGILSDEKPRPFSTLNSPHAFSIMWTFVMVAFYFFIKEKSKRFIYLGLFFVYLSAMFFSFTRGSYVCLILCMIGFWMFKGRKTTFVFYSTLISLFILIVVFSRELILLFEQLTVLLNAQTQTQQKLFRLTTISDRLMGFDNLKNSALFWEPFGNFDISKIKNINYNDEFFTHDVLSASLLRFGYVPVSIIILSLTYLLYLFHSKAWSQKNIIYKNYILLSISIVVTVLFASLGGSTIHVFPWNYFFWFYLSIFFYYWCREEAH